MTDNYAERGPGTARPSVTDEPKAVAREYASNFLGDTFVCQATQVDIAMEAQAARISALEAECAALRKTLESIRDCNQITGIYGTKRLAADALIGIYHAAEEQSHD